MKDNITKKGESARGKKSLICFPPFVGSALSGPHLAPPLLTSILKKNGFAADCTDLNILTIQRILRSDFRKKLVELVCSESQEIFSNFEKSLALWLLNSDIPSIFNNYLYMLRQVLQLFGKVFFPQPNRIEKIDLSDETSSYWRNLIYHEILAPCLLKNYQVIGFSIAFAEQLVESLFFAKLIRQHTPNVIIIIGGSQITLLSKVQINHLAESGLFDLIVIGNAEKDISSIIQQSERTAEGQILEASKLGKEDLAHIPRPQFNSDELLYYFGRLTLPVLVSKGCYWGKCTYCDYAKMNAFLKSKYIFRPVNHVYNNIKLYNSLYTDPQFLLISDAVSPSYYRKLAELATSGRLALNTWSYMLNCKGLEQEFFDLLSNAGVSTINFGSETTCDRILKKMNKSATRADILKNIDYAHKANIKIVMNIIVDFPGTTFKEAIKVADDIVELGDAITVINPQRFDLTIDTPISDNPDSFGIELENRIPSWTNHGYHSLKFHTSRGLSKSQHEAVVTIFQTLSSKKRVKRRVNTLPSSIGDKTIISFDRSCLVYLEESPIVDIVSLRYRWQCSQEEAILFNYLFSLPQRRISLSRLHAAWDKYISRPYDGRNFENWFKGIIDTGIIETISEDI